MMVKEAQSPPRQNYFRSCWTREDDQALGLAVSLTWYHLRTLITLLTMVNAMSTFPAGVM